MKRRIMLVAIPALALAALASKSVEAADDEGGKKPAASQQALPSNAEEKGNDANFTIRTDVRRVLLDVSVKDSAGGFVSNLTKDHFKVFDNGRPQEIVEFANSDIPVTVGIVVDESGSMRPKRPEVITAALSFITASNPQDEVFVTNFNEKVYHGLPDTVLFSDNVNQLRKALWSTAPEGRTALYDAIAESLHQLDMGRRDKKTLVVISDGGDNVSTHNFKDILQMVESSAATVYTIGIFDNSDPDRNPAVLKKLAEVSGGEVFFPEKLEGIVPVCKKIAQDIRTRYTLGYVPPPGKSGKDELRHVKVEVTAPAHGKLIARTRSIYRYSEDQTADRAR